MRYKNLLIVLISFGFIEVYSQLPVGRDTITVIEGGNVLKSAWAGGLNFCSASAVDLDLDGKKDLVMFDKVNLFAHGIFRCFMNKGGAGETKYIYDAQYSSKFPAVQQWAMLFDYDNDGKEDLFTYTSGGIKAYKNTSVIGNVSFQLKKNAIMSNITPTSSTTYAQIYSSPVSIPGFSDIDSDGDLDILTFSSSGFSLEYHKNMSMEMYSIADSLVFQLDEYTWGNISETNCVVSLNQFMKPLSTEFQKVLHAGSCIMCFDRDNDGDKDLILGDISCSTLHYMENGGTISNAHMIDTTKLYPNYPNKASGGQVIRINQFPCTYNLDLNNDGKKDLIASPNTPNSENFQSVWYYQNASSTPTVDFQFVKKNFLQDDMIELGEGAFPAFLDVDADGLLDLVVGNHGYYIGTSNRTQLTYYRNTGTLSQPSYSLMTRDFAGLSINTAALLSGIVPAPGDIDGDGDVDLILGDYFGKIHWLENTAGTGNPCNFSVFNNNTFSITVSAAYPQVIDVDRDGVLDLLIGSRNGKISYYRNTGTVTAPTFTLITNAFGNVDVTRDLSLFGSSEGSCAPFMYDEAGSYKLLCGSISGSIYYYDNIDGNLSGIFNKIDSTVNNIADGPRSTIQYIDVNGDAKRDLFVGNYGGGLSFYSSKSAIGINELNSTSTDDIIVYPNPSKDLIHINFIGQMEKIEVTLLDILGKEILSTSSNLGAVTLNCEALAPGIYLLRSKCFIKSRSKTVYRKLIIQ